MELNEQAPIPNRAELDHLVSLLRATLESTADGILVVDRSGRIVLFNQRFREIWNIPEGVLALGARRGRARSSCSPSSWTRRAFGRPCARSTSIPSGRVTT